jgi:hypothetical protein
MPLRKQGRKPNPPEMMSKSVLCHDPMNPPTQKKRECTECRRKFLSKNSANRKCPDCADVYYPVKMPRYNR